MKKLMKKKMNLFGKEISVFVVALFAITLVSAALVPYFAQVMVSADITGAITTTGGVCEFETVAGGDYELCLIDVTNNLDKDVPVSIKLQVQELVNNDYVNLENDDGFLVGLTEDVSYCFKGQGEMLTPVEITDCSAQYEDWMLQNVDWMDWEILTQPYPGEYDTTLITNHGGDSADVIDLTTTPIPGEITVTGETISPLLNFQPVIYVDSAVALEPGEYRVIFEIIPDLA